VLSVGSYGPLALDRVELAEGLVKLTLRDLLFLDVEGVEDRLVE
jgi:hypothetical protein